MLLIAAACGGSDIEDESASTTTEQTATDQEAAAGEGFPDAVQVIVANSPGTLTTTGQQRVMTALIGEGPNDFLGGADRPVTIVFSPVDADPDDGTEERVDGTFLTTNASALGLYVSFYEFPLSGQWDIRIEADGRDIGGTRFVIEETSNVPNIGDAAPPSVSPVAADPGDIPGISTDPAPDPEFYDLTIGDAVANGRPTLIAFATPAFCQTALCGPTMETVKVAVEGRDDLDVVHVEPFDLTLATAGQLIPIDIMDEWGLVTEPWVFVVDADGTVSASFEGILGQDELEAALDNLG